MHRIDHATADDTDPEVPVFTDGNPATGVPATQLTPEWLNDVQENIMHVIEEAGVDPTKGESADLYDAIAALIADAAATNMLTQGKREIPIPVDYIQPRETNGCAAADVLETSTYLVNRRYRDFADDVQEYGQFSYALPKSWDGGTIEFRVGFSHGAATSFGTVWSLQAVSIGDDDALDVDFGTAVDVTKDGGTTDDMYWSAWSTAVTVAAAGDDKTTVFQISRKVGDAGDDLDAPARLHEVQLRVNFDAGNDA